LVNFLPLFTQRTDIEAIFVFLAALPVAKFVAVRTGKRTNLFVTFTHKTQVSGRANILTC
jgi:hypothetical protein